MPNTPNSSYNAESARADLMKYGRKLAERGLVSGPGGNTSVRAGEIVYVKGSGVAMEDCSPEDYIGVSLKTGDVVDGRIKPSCEILMHLGIYLARPDIHAVVHTHPPACIGLASTGKTIPPMFPDFVLLGKEVALVPYVVPAGNELAQRVARAAADHVTILLANHGLVALGSNMREAYFRTLVADDATRCYLAGLTAGDPHIFTDKELYDVDHLGAEDYRRALLRGEVG